MQHLKYATTGILVLFAAGLSACGSDDPTTTGSTNPPAAQSEQTTTEATPAPSGEQGAAGQEQPAQSN